MKSKQQLQQKHKKINLLRQNGLFNQTQAFEQLVMFMDYKIRKEFTSFTLLSICGSERNKFMVSTQFENSFSQLDLQEKLNLYEKTISYALQIENQNTTTPSLDKPIEEADLELNDRQTLRFALEIEKASKWISVSVTLDGFKLTCELFEINLRNYLIRKSKKTGKDCYVLQCIHQTEPSIIRFSFLNYTDRQKHLPMLQNLIDRGYNDMIRHMLKPEYNSNYQIKQSPFRQNKSVSESVYEQQAEHTQNCNNKTSHLRRLKAKHTKESKMHKNKHHSNLVEEIMKTGEEQYLDDELPNIVDKQNQMAIEQEQNQIRQTAKSGRPHKYYKNIFAVMLPLASLADLQRLDNFKSVYCNSNNTSFIYQATDNHLHFKMEQFTQLDALLALRAISNIPMYKNWHPEVIQGQIKMRITSQNSAIVYQKHKAYSKWYRERDYLYLRHIFCINKDYYVVDKSIENSNFVPFQTILRGRITHQIIKINTIEAGCRILISCQFEHAGLLNPSQLQELTQRYLKGFERLQPYYTNKQFCNRLINYFRTDWLVDGQCLGQPSQTHTSRSRSEVRSVDFQQQISCNLDEDDLFFSIKDADEDDNDKISVHQLKQEQLLINDKQMHLRNVPEIIHLNEQGLIILPKDYLQVPHPNRVIQSFSKNRVALKYADFLMRDHWVMNDNGGFRLVNQQIMAAQNNVITFIMSTLKKNLFSGKGALNISLPVTIFNCDSNLQRLCLGLSLAPDYLQRAATLTDPVERMKYCLIFGLSNSLLYFDIEKPFNPILGETYQGFIAGCPVYAQQVSHHPPITAIYMIGRGYKIYASLQATVNLHINSADGINIGWYHILFDDGQQVCFQTPPAEFSGLTIGDRKFNFKGKGYYFDRNNLLYGEMKFQDDSGLFSSNKWKFNDQLQVQLLKVTKQFLEEFILNFPNDKPSPSKKQIVERYFKMQGRWPLGVTCEGEQLFSVNQDLPFELIDYQYPLNSNSNYREDLYYRKKNDLSRSQSQKERLQVIQRDDRKWRAKYHKSEH